MKGILQKLILFFLLFSAHITGLSAQKNRFIYIQTDNKQSFYVKLENRLFSSSATGYLIIPKLADGVYTLSIGFPKNEWPVQNIRCVIKDTDGGYLLKHFSGKGWGLLNLQSMQVQMAEKEKASRSTIVTETADDTFSTVLASVVNDPGILIKQKIMQDTVTAPVTADNIKDKGLIGKKNEETALIEKKKADSIQYEPGILKLGSESTSDEINISFLDIEGSNTDTVTISIRKEKPVIAMDTEEQVIKPVPDQSKEKTKARDSKFIDMELPNPNSVRGTMPKAKDSIVISEKKGVVPEVKVEMDSDSSKTVVKQAVENTNCKKIAGNDDFLNLRKLMAAEMSDEAMINVALKKFKLLCFSTEHIKNLGVLFIKEEGKYKFYVAAYPFVSDPADFGSLEQQLQDSYFITRFKAMLHR